MPPMCRNIRRLYNYDPPATGDEVRDAATQFVRKVSGFRSPSKTNAAAFDRAVDEVAAATARLLDSLVTDAAPRDRAADHARARARSADRYGVE